MACRCLSLSSSNSSLAGLGAILLTAIISAAVIIRAKHMPYLFAGWSWYTITILPVIGIIQVGDVAMADRYSYLPSVGIAVMLHGEYRL